MHLGRQGLFWTDLGSPASIIERVAATPPTATMDDWLDLGRRARADQLSTEEIDALLAAIERSRDPLQWPGLGSSAPASAPANAHQIAAFLESVLFASADSGLRERVWGLLAPLPMPGTQVDATETPGVVRVRIAFPRTNRPSFGWVRSGGRDMRPLIGLRALRGARIDGHAIELRPASGGDPAVDRSVALSARDNFPLEAELETELAPGSHVLELDVASAGVDSDLATALGDGLARPGPPERWGSTAPVTTTTLRIPIQVPARDAPPTPDRDLDGSEPANAATDEESPP